MLQAASQPNEDDDAVPLVDHPNIPARPAIKPVVAAAQPVTDRYAMRSRPNIPAIATIIIFHILAIGALVQVRNHVHRTPETRLTVVNLTPPPPPPAADTPPPPPSAPDIVAPPPIVQVPMPPIQAMQTTPDPHPTPTPAPMIVAPGPPAPVAPPAPPSLVQGGDLATQMVAGKPPRYPVESRRKREQGTVVLAITLAIDGGVESIVVSQSSGFPRLDKAAKEAVKDWRWKPAIRGGQPVRVRGVVEIPFVLRIDAA